MFPSGIFIDPIKRQYRTSEINSVFSLIASISRVKKPKSKNSPSDLDDESGLVERTEKMSNLLIENLEQFCSIIK